MFYFLSIYFNDIQLSSYQRGLLITLANSFDTNQTRYNVCPELDTYCLTLLYSLHDILKKANFENKSKDKMIYRGNVKHNTDHTMQMRRLTRAFPICIMWSKGQRNAIAI